MEENGREKGTDSTGTPRWNAKRIVALAAVVLLAGMYLAAFVSALMASPGAGDLFRFCLGMTIVVPVFAWVAIWAIGVMRHRHTIASADILQSNPQARRKMEEAVSRELNSTSEEETPDKSGAPDKSGVPGGAGHRGNS